MKEDIFVGISPEMQEILLPLQTQIETLQRQLDNTVAIKDAEIAHLKEVIETYQRMHSWSKAESFLFRRWYLMFPRQSALMRRAIRWSASVWST